jgi:hypothetical protein
MKKFGLIAGMLACACLTFFSCSKSDETSASAELSQEIKDAIFRLGFTVDGAYAADGGYIVEGDIFLSDEDLNRAAEHQRLLIGDEEQYHTFNTVNAGGGRVIKVAIVTGTSGGTLPASYIAPLDIALARFNAENLTLTFQRVSSGADITIVKGNGNYLASAGFPSGGNPYDEVKVNSNAIGSGTSSTFQNYLATILAHELGHCIGYRHTDWFNRALSCGGAPSNEGQSTSGVGAVLIPGTPGQTGVDMGSWMLACIGSGQNRPFSSNDKTALSYLY